MKISELKQPYRRMAEYLAERNTDEECKNKNILEDAFVWYKTDSAFWLSLNKSVYPEITEGIKIHFPPDFDFSEEIYNDSGEKIGLIVDLNTMEKKTKEDSETYYKKLTENYFDSAFGVELSKDYQLNMSKRYTQLAKDGKFDELPDTCEFSESVWLEVWDKDKEIQIGKADVVGKFKGKFISLFINNEFAFWNYAQLPTPKIDFSQFKAGDVVEVELTHNEKRIGWFDYVNNNHLVINVLKRKGNQVCNGGNCAGSKMLNKEKIKSITKIK